MTLPSSRWLLRDPTPARSASLVLYCFAHAGGGAQTFVPWRRALGPDIDVRAIQLPGRGSRFSEPPERDFDVLIAKLAAELPLENDRPFAFFGHSMGALIAFELARHLVRHGAVKPVHVLVSGAEGPRHERSRTTPLADAPDERLLQTLRDYEGSPSALFDNPEWLSIVIPIFRSDLVLLKSYRYRPQSPLAIPIAVLCGRTDVGVDPTRASDWKQECIVSCDMHWFDGGHFFIDSAQQSVTEAIRRILGRWLPDR